METLEGDAPAEKVAAARAAGCRYDDAGPWNGGRNCSGRLYPGTEALGEALKARWGGSYGGYSCRPNTADASQLSVHGTGRAVDWFQPSKAAGDEAAEWLVANAEAFGVQLVIWNRRDWFCNAGWTSYGGPNPHTDHIHVELTIPAANNNTASTYRKELFTVGQYEDLTQKLTRMEERLGNVAKRQGVLTRIAFAQSTNNKAEEAKARKELEKLGKEDA